MVHAAGAIADAQTILIAMSEYVRFVIIHY